MVRPVALLTPLSLEAARELARPFGLDVAGIEPLALGSVNSNFRLVSSDGTLLFARLYEEQALEGARAELALLTALAEAGVPVPRALPSEGDTLPLHAGKPFAVFPWVEGETLCLARLLPEHCRKVGEALAQVHVASRAFAPLGPGRFQPADMLARLDGVERSGPSEALVLVLHEVRALLASYVERRATGLPSGVVHGDLFRDNVLFRGDDIAALLDFESVFHGPFVYDLMVTLAAFCYRDAFDLELASALFAGYVAVRPLEEGERAQYRVEGAIGCLRFATTRITDFLMRTPEGETPRRDYRRFLERLRAIEAGALDSLFSG
jgi:homoserine kinase type II